MLLVVRLLYVEIGTSSLMTGYDLANQGVNTSWSLYFMQVFVTSYSLLCWWRWLLG